MRLCVCPVFRLLGLWRDKLSLVHLCFFSLVETIFCFWLPQFGKGSMHLCICQVFRLLGLWRDKLSLVHLCFFTLVEPNFCFWLPQFGKGLMHLCMCQVFRLLEALVRSTLSCLVDAKLTVETQCGLKCRSSRQELRETSQAGTLVSSLTGRGSGRYTSVVFSITAAFTAKGAGPPYETTVIRNRAVLLGSCRLQFQLFSERLRVRYDFGMESFT